MASGDIDNNERSAHDPPVTRMEEMARRTASNHSALSAEIDFTVSALSTKAAEKVQLIENVLFIAAPLPCDGQS